MSDIWQCRNCKRRAHRDQWGTYRGSLCCSTCLAAAYVDTLVKVEGYWCKKPCDKHAGQFHLECPACQMNQSEWVETAEAIST